MRLKLTLGIVLLAAVVVVESQISILKPVKNAGKLFDDKILSPIQSQINKAIKLQKSTIKGLINVDPDAQMSTIFTNLTGLNATQLKACYNTTIGNEEFNIFENTVFDGIQMYYKHFTENFDLVKFPQKVQNLFASFGEISAETVKCIANPSEYKVGVNQLTDWSNNAFKKLSGEMFDANNIDAVFNKFANRPLSQGDARSDEEQLVDDDEEVAGIASNDTRRVETTTPKPEGATQSTTTQAALTPNTPGTEKPKKDNILKLSPILGGTNTTNKRVKRDVTVDAKCLVRNRSQLAARLDWQAEGKVTPVKYQGECGSCWAFASLSSLESAYLIRGKTRNLKFDLSEQQLLDCARQDGCKGGTSVDAFNYILENRGVASEKKLPYAFKEKRCSAPSRKNARIKDYCLRGVYVKVNNKPEILSDQDIQMIVRQFGPVYATMYAEDNALKHYKSGVYNNPSCSKHTNHAITIVGWDESSWIIKNSWGRGWGEAGFFRLKRGQNMCGLNTYVTYPIL